jgi:hypothetical protein
MQVMSVVSRQEEDKKGSGLEFFHESFHRTSNDRGPVSIS